mgnify:CR=1 FL=1
MMADQKWPSCPDSPPQAVPITILYGTQTFTALEVATLLAQRAARRGFAPRLSSMDEFPRIELIDQKLVVFVASTTGDGEVPETMLNFWRFLLRRSLPADIFAEMRFSVFGLGDSSYPKFNAVARRLDVRLRQLGASLLHEVHCDCCGIRDQHLTDDDNFAETVAPHKLLSQCCDCRLGSATTRANLACLETSTSGAPSCGLHF